MLLFTHATSNRLQYICDTIFGNQVIITTSAADVKKFDGTIINYSKDKINENEIHIQPHHLLFEEHIYQQEIDCFTWHNSKAFFKTDKGIGFDILAASFYLISRYEEYTTKEIDEHQSFHYSQSLAFKENFLQLPLVNIWWEKLQLEYPNLSLKQSSFKFISSFDIDISFKYKHHSLIKNILSSGKEILHLHIKNLLKRWLYVLNKTKPDPYDVFDWLENLHQKFSINTIYFCLCQTKRGNYDVNLSPNNKHQVSLFKKLDKTNTIAIHPSYSSGLAQIKNTTRILKKEVSQLQTIIHQPITKSRQHYLVMQLPNTYNSLLNQNIAEDYTMGYNYINGFRASFCKPFKWFNLNTNAATNLLIHPFCAMDSNFIFFGDFNTETALNQLKLLFENIRKFDGECITVFHNHFADNNKINWKNLYENFIYYVYEQKLNT